MKTQRTTYYGTAADDEKLMVACGMIHPLSRCMKCMIYRYQTGDDDGVFFFDTPAVRFSNSRQNQQLQLRDDGTVYHNTNFDWDTHRLSGLTEQC